MSNNTLLAVLVVEDSPFFADLTVRILKRSGFEVTSRLVFTRDALLDTLKNGKWDIILSDNVMPDLNALGALEARNDICSHIPFIIISEDISRRELDEAFERGCSSFLPKDRITELPKLIRSVLNIP